MTRPPAPSVHRVELDPELIAAIATRPDPDRCRPRAAPSVSAPTGPPGVGSLATGALGEELAARHLARDDGLELIARNWRIAVGELRGELDLVALDHDAATVVVCEVKTRRDAARFGGAVQAVPPRKRTQVRRLTAAFLCAADLPYARVSLDLVAVDLGRRASLTHLPAVL
jgi:putative endonuclease